MKSKAELELEDIIHDKWAAWRRGEVSNQEMDAFNKWVERQYDKLDRNWELSYESYED